MQNWFLSATRNFLKIFTMAFVYNQFLQTCTHSNCSSDTSLKENCPIDWKDFLFDDFATTTGKENVLNKQQLILTFCNQNCISWHDFNVFFWTLFILYSTGWEGSEDVLDYLSSWLVVVLLMNMSKKNFIFWKFLSSHLHTLWDTCFVSFFLTGTIGKPV